MFCKSSQAATLLDVFVVNKGTQHPVKHRNNVDWSQEFLRHIAHTIDKNPKLSDIVEVTQGRDGKFSVSAKPGVTADALAGRLHECQHESEHNAETEVDFPGLYADLAKLTVAAIEDIFTEGNDSEGNATPAQEAKVFDVAKLREVYTTKTVPFCEEWSAQLDISFESGADRGRAIACPDPHSLTGPSREAWGKMVATPGAFYRSWVARTYHAIPHEVFHCVQSFTAGFCDKGKWFSEFGATAVCVNLLCYMARAQAFREAHPAAERLFPQGSLELLMVDLEQTVGHLREAFAEAEWVEDLYVRWESSFGREAPERLTTVPGASYYAKSRIALGAPYIGSTNKQEYRDLVLMCLDTHTHHTTNKTMTGRR